MATTKTNVTRITPTNLVVAFCGFSHAEIGPGDKVTIFSCNGGKNYSRKIRASKRDVGFFKLVDMVKGKRS